MRTAILKATNGNEIKIDWMYWNAIVDLVDGFLANPPHWINPIFPELIMDMEVNYDDWFCTDGKTVINEQLAEQFSLALFAVLVNPGVMSNETYFSDLGKEVDYPMDYIKGASFMSEIMGFVICNQFAICGEDKFD